jgi:hypothetical protein
VFADGRGLTGALLTAWEGVEPVGMSGGHLRGLYADFLDEAAPLLGADPTEAAEAFRAAAAQWHAFAEAALPADVPEYARLRELTAAVAAGVAQGAPDAAAGAELWQQLQDLDEKPPVAPDFGVLAERMTAVHAAESAAVESLRALEHRY